MWVYEYLETIEDRSICHFRRFLIKRKIIFCGRIFGGSLLSRFASKREILSLLSGGGLFLELYYLSL